MAGSLRRAKSKEVSLEKGKAGLLVTANELLPHPWAVKSSFFYRKQQAPGSQPMSVKLQKMSTRGQQSRRSRGFATEF